MENDFRPWTSQIEALTFFREENGHLYPAYFIASSLGLLCETPDGFCKPLWESKFCANSNQRCHFSRSFVRVKINRFWCTA